MGRKIKRRLHIGDKVYYRVVDKSKMDLYPSSKMHIRVHQDNGSRSLLYIDVNAWHFEISPKNIKCAIKFALSNDWDPQLADRSMYISMNEDGFYVLPEGIKHGFDIY